MASSPSSSQRLWDFLSLANIWLSWKRVLLCMSVLLELSGCPTGQVPWSHWASARSCSHLLAVVTASQLQQYHKAWMDVLGLTGRHHTLSTVPSTPQMDCHCVSLLFFPILTPNSFSLVYWLVVWTCSVGFRASAVFLWDFPPTVCGSATAAHLELLLQVLTFKIELSSKTCRTNCDLGVKKEALSSIWLPGKYSVGRKDFLPHLLYI